MLSRYYAAWPFVEYGLFLALCYAVREALGDTIAYSIAFQARDRMRHLQDIVHLMFDLAEAREGFTDGGARDAWMTDPVLVPSRENIERIVSCRDWFETVVAVNLVFEPMEPGDGQPDDCRGCGLGPVPDQGQAHGRPPRDGPRRGADLRGPVPGTDRQAHRAGPGTMFRSLTTGILPGPAAGRIPRSARPRRDY